MKKDFLDILKEHKNSYPKMEPQDYGKLIFQSVFGPEHLADEKEMVLLYLRREMSEIQRDSTPKIPEDIGGGLCRFPLAVCSLEKRAERLLADLFLLTMQNHCGSKDEVSEKLEILKELGVPGMEEWAKSWIEKECFPVHHSDLYRKAYHPHYRLLRKDYAGSFSVLLKIAELLEKEAPVIVGIDGQCGSGKTHLAEVIDKLFSCNIVHMDDFYLPFAQRRQDFMRIPGGNIDFLRLKTEVLEPIERGKAIYYRPYNCQKGEITKSFPMKPEALTIVEGSYSHHPLTGVDYDLKVFLTCGQDEREKRLRKREGKYYSVFEKQWIPMEENYFQFYEIKKNSDIVIDTSDFFV